MIELQPVAELVDDHVVQDLRRRQQQKAVEIKASFDRAASPPGLLVPDRDPAVSDTDSGCKVRRPLRKNELRPLREMPQLLSSERVESPFA